MATNKRKRIIRALADEHGISYTTAMRAHDTDKTPTPSPSWTFPDAYEGGTPVSYRHPTEFIVAGHEVSLDAPLVVLGESGNGNTYLVSQVITQGVLKGATVQIIVDPYNTIVRPLKGIDGPGEVSLTTIGDMGPTAAWDGLRSIQAELARRKKVLAAHKAAHWLELPWDVRKQENVTHPVLVVEAFNDMGAYGMDAELHDFALNICQEVRRTGRAAGFCSIALRGENTEGLAPDLQQSHFAHATLAQCFLRSEYDHDMIALITSLAENSEEVLKEVPIMQKGQAFLLEPGRKAEKRQASLKRDQHLGTSPLTP